MRVWVEQNASDPPSRGYPPLPRRPFGRIISRGSGQWVGLERLGQCFFSFFLHPVTDVPAKKRCRQEDARGISSDAGRASRLPGTATSARSGTRAGDGSGLGCCSLGKGPPGQVQVSMREKGDAVSSTAGALRPELSNIWTASSASTRFGMITTMAVRTRTS